MLDLYYATERPLPADPEEICRRICANTPAEREAVALILREFFKREARLNQHGGKAVATQRRVEGEIKKYKEMVKLGKINGVKGGRPKTKNNHTPNPQLTQNNHIQIQNQIQNQRKSNTTPLPPVNGGTEILYWCNETIQVRMGRKKRLPKLDAFHGGRAGDVVAFLNRSGFHAEIVTMQ